MMQSVKGYTARLLNGERRGPLWQQRFYDRAIRNERHLLETVRYIHDNPVVAGLVAHPEDYQMSSAFPHASTDLELFL
jgi:REP element-mobilizing transposase RayT